MTRFVASPEFEPRVADWLEADPDHAPEQVLETVLAAFPSIPQRRASRLPWRPAVMIRSAQLGVAAAIVVAIGGAFLVITSPGGNIGAPPPPTPSTPATSPSATAIASASAAPSVAACELLTTTQVASVGGAGLGATAHGSGAGAETSCRYSNGPGDTIVEITDTTSGARAAFDAVKAGSGAQVVADLGVDAVFDPSSDTLFVVAGDRMVAIRAGHSGQTAEARLALERQFAQLVVANR